MRDYTLVHLSDAVLLRDLAALLAQDRVTTATLLAHIAEVDARRLYAPAGYASMHAYCVEELRLSEDAAFRRIRAARAARQYPALFAAVADGRLHLAGVCLLAPHLTEEDAAELMEASTHRRKSEIEGFLARRFPPPEVPASVRALAVTTPGLMEHATGHVGWEPPQLVPGRVGGESTEGVGATDYQLVLGRVEEARVEPAQALPERYILQLTIAKSTREKLRYAHTLLSHAVPTGDVAQILYRALDALILLHEKRKLGAITQRPHASGVAPRRPGTTRRPGSQGTTVRKRYVPPHVRRAVWERDQGRCTFVGTTGHRCEAQRFLEFDHVDPVGRGGKATVEGMRLRCRTHNQHEAERIFGTAFMSRKRQEARLAAAEARANAAAETRAKAEASEARARAEAKARAQAATKEQTLDVVAGLRGLGCRIDQARRAAEFSETLHDATLEERMRASLKFLCGRRVQGPARPEGIPRA